MAALSEYVSSSSLPLPHKLHEDNDNDNEEEVATTTFQTRGTVLLLNYLQTALLVLPKKWSYFASAFPIILTRTRSIVKLLNTTQQQQQQQSSQQQPNSLAALEAEKRLMDAEFALYAEHLVNFIEPFATRSSKQSTTTANTTSTTLTGREHRWILRYCFHLLSKIYSSIDLITKFEPILVPHLVQIIATCARNTSTSSSASSSTSSSSISCMNILAYPILYSNWGELKARLDIEMMDLEDNDDAEYDSKQVDEINNFVQWDYLGIGCLVYLLCVKKIENWFLGPKSLSHVFLFKMCKPFIEKLVECGIPSLCLLGKSLAKYMLKFIPNYGFAMKIIKGSEETTTGGDLHEYFAFAQALINFMASCPDDKERSDAYNMLNDYISKFTDEGRFELLATCLKMCPYASLFGLIVHRLKEEIRLEYDSYLTRINRLLNPAKPYNPLQPPTVQQQVAPSPTSVVIPPMVQMDKETITQLKLMSNSSFFLNGKTLELLLEILPRFVDEPALDTADAILHSLNLYYFLLLRDNEANVTGIMNQKLLKQFKVKIFEPLNEKLTVYLKKIDRAEVEVTRTENSKKQAAKHVESVVTAQDEKEIDDMIENMTDAELEQFLQATADSDDEDDDAIANKGSGSSFDEQLKEFKAIQQKDRNMLQLRLTMIQDCLQRIGTCLQDNKHFIKAKAVDGEDDE